MNFSTCYKDGFTQGEIDLLLREFPQISLKLFYANLGTHTGMIISNEIIIYRNDVIDALNSSLYPNDKQFRIWD
jgi:hypothetical protein